MKSLQDRIKETFADVRLVLTGFVQEELDKAPFANSWTPGQVAEHMLKSLSRSSAVLNGPAKKTVRDPGENIKPIEDLFLNYDIKMKSPDFILPTAIQHDRDDLLNQFQQQEELLLNASHDDLALTCTIAEFPTVGYLTRNEWIHFYIVHTQRHTHQLKNILEILRKKNNVANTL